MIKWCFVHDYEQYARRYCAIETSRMQINLKSLFRNVDIKFEQQFGFRIRDTTCDKIVDYMFVPKDSSSLAVTRILFGLCMLFDIPDERGGASLTKRWGDPRTCHFPLFTILQPMSLPYMAMVYCAMWFGALGITLGYKFRWSSLIFTCSYWYLFLIDKSFWNNHSYLFGLVAILLTCTEANCYWSLDALTDPSKRKNTVPYWNYFIIKYQFFILYFMAGLKKGTAEWLTGYSVQRLSEHWVFEPFKLFLTEGQTDYLIIHWFIFVFDLTIAMWMMCSYTRNFAMVFCALFHLMNSRLFTIGMFPWVCLATMPLFYSFDWPKKTLKVLEQVLSNISRSHVRKIQLKLVNCSGEDNEQKIITDTEVCGEDKTIMGNKYKNEHETHIDSNDKVPPCNNMNNKAIAESNSEVAGHDDDQNRRKKLRICIMICIYVFLQAFLPFSHFITKGYNNWTDGLYGYSWDMMVHTWESHSIVIRVVDNQNNKEYFYDPNLHTPNDRWTRHGDMLHQYAQCLKFNIQNDKRKVLSENISIYIDVWYSMNGRFTQRMFDPRVDLLKAEWSPFSKVPYLMPLIDEALEWRSLLAEIKKDVLSWSNNSNVIFIADFPGYEQEQFIPTELHNVTLTILEGAVIFELNQQSNRLTTEDRINVQSNAFHKVLNKSKKPAYYMYTFINTTDTNEVKKDQPKLPIAKELLRRFSNMITFAKLAAKSLFGY